MEISVSPSTRTWRIEVADAPDDPDFMDAIVEALEQMLSVYNVDFGLLDEGIFWIETDDDIFGTEVYNCAAGAMAIAQHMQAAGELGLRSSGDQREWVRTIAGYVAEWRRDNMLYKQQVRRMDAGKESES